MIKIIAIAALALAVVSACNGASKRTERKSTSALKQSATLVRDIDGDTIVVSINGVEKHVRLVGIDTPETHKPGVKVECGGPQASALAAKWASPGDRVTLTYDFTQDRTDRYGRLLAYVSAHHHSLQLDQLRAGWAEVYVYQHHPFGRVESFHRAQESAKKHDRGAWKLCGGDFHSEQ
jgi:micrococcal nuclease